MNIILDTNILHGEGLVSLHMAVLERLARDRIIKIYVVDFVRREFISKHSIDVAEDIGKVISRLDGVMEKLSGDNDRPVELVAAKGFLGELNSKIEDLVNKQYESWVDRLGVSEIEFDTDHMGRVIDDYFSGGGAFSSPKNRSDIPDSIIMASVCDFVEKNGEAAFIVGDKKFRKSMADIDGISVYDSLNSCFSSSYLREHASDSQICVFIEGKKFAKKFQDNFRAGEPIIGDLFLDSDEVFGKSLLGDRVHFVEIGGLEQGSISNLKVQSAFLLSDDHFIADFTFRCQAGLIYVADYAEYLEIEKTNRDASLESMNGDGMCEIHEDFIVDLTGVLEIKLSEKLALPDIVKIVEDLENRDEMSFDIVIHRVKLVSPID